jgi:hypothetical protein
VFEGTLATVTESVNDDIAVIATPTTTSEMPTTAIAMPATCNKTYTSSNSCQEAKRAKTLALGTAVIGGGVMESGAQDSIMPKGSTPKGKTGDGNDFTTICQIELIVDCDQKPFELKELKSARIKSVFPIICCINNKDITTMVCKY